MDIWEKLQRKEPLEPEERKAVCNGLLTTEERMESLILKYFRDEDFQEVYRRRIGKGLIGGKACGVLLARKLIAERLPEYVPKLLDHHSYFIGSDVFYRYLLENDCLELRERHRREKERFREAGLLKERLRNGHFSKDFEDALKQMLLYYKDRPVIVRSSSFLEDGFGKAFSGKYESVFCMNMGSQEERLEELKEAIRRVYASTMNESALEYRKKWNLLDADEQMALLIQQVEGERQGEYYFPIASGMGCSYNPYKWMEHMNPDAGMMRLVAGLGTRAVERTPGDYPRLVCLDHARANIHTSIAERHKYSQRQADVLSLSQGGVQTEMVDRLIPLLSEEQKKLVLSRDSEAESMLYQRGMFKRVYFSDCGGLVNHTEFMEMMKRILKMLEKEYERPVDIEFALRMDEKMQVRVNLFQCRPLQTGVSEQIRIPAGVDDAFLFDLRCTSMKRSKKERVDVIVWVDPRNYYECPYAKKAEVGRVIGCINQYYEGQDKKLMLLVPGRVGTSSPELGVPVSYADISRFAAICEVAYSEAGYRPDLSYGSHMFQDLVEADVYYGAINENSKTRLYQPKLLKPLPEIFSKVCVAYPEQGEIVKVYDLSEMDAQLLLDAKEGRAVCWLKQKDH